MIAQIIAHYRITAKLGAGGMGEVYRATDSKLGRDVALKVLPEAFAADPQRMQRFQREAQVLAALNHPNIAAINGLERRRMIPSHGNVPLAAACGAAAFALLLTGGCKSSPGPDLPAPIEFRIAAGEKLRFPASDAPLLALSPDGATVVFCAVGPAGLQLYSRATRGTNSTALPGSEGASSPFFSPDGNWVGFFAEGKLKKILRNGENPVVLADAPTPRGGAWTRDGLIYFAPSHDSGLWVVPAAGGPAKQVTMPARDKGEFTHRWPAPLPGGEVIYTVGHSASPDFFADAHIDIYIPARGSSMRMNIYGSSVRFSPPGHLLVARAGDVFAVPFDPGILFNTAVGFPLLRRVAGDSSGGAAQLDAARDGSIVYVSSQAAAIAAAPAH